MDQPDNRDFASQSSFPVLEHDKNKNYQTLDKIVTLLLENISS